MSLHLPCPNCGADVVFRSPALPSLVCGTCRTMLVRSDEGIAQLGIAAVLPFDVSPVQIGMRGIVDAKAFDVIGRVRWSWNDGAWNEWLLLFDDGSHAWLGEAMGQFMLLWESPFAAVRSETLKKVAKGQDPKLGHDVQIDGRKLTIADARWALCVTAEGELPFAAPSGWRVYSVDLRGPAGECANLQRDGTSVSFFQGRYVTLAELAPRGMRVIEGWALPDYAA
jgi:ribosomal protein S27E